MIKKFHVMILMMVMACSGVFGRSYAVKDIVNPNIADRSQYVADPDDLLSPEVKRVVNARLNALRDSTSAEMAVVVVPSIDSDDVEGFSTALFSHFGLGKKDKNNGLLLLIAPYDHVARFETGYGLEGVLPDITLGKVMRNIIIPEMREDNLDGAVMKSVNVITQVLESPESVDEIFSAEKSGRGEDDVLDIEVLLNFVLGVIIFCFLGAAVMFFLDCRAKGRSNFTRTLDWERHESTYLVLGICSLGLGLIFYFLAKGNYRRLRNKRIKCSTCGTLMNKLGEEEDNELLAPNQDFEEKLNTVDYDVWVCPDCGTVERFPFHVNQSKYKECPKCHTVAERLVTNRVVRPATTRQTGYGEKEYQCLYCGNRRKEPYVIPKKDDGSGGAAVAGAVLGSMLGGGGRGGGGGGFGGGFGGGMSGGGGATGRW